MNFEKCDTAIVGAGIVGLGTALALTERFPHNSLVVIDKEPEVASHQTGHNSGVLHAGIYYKPGSYKAKLCLEGGRLMKDFCQENGVPYDRCGKVIVATTDRERDQLQALYERGTANGIQGLEVIAPERVRELEPHARAVRALYSPNTAIVDFTQVARAMAAKVEGRGAHIILGAEVSGIRRSEGGFHLETNRGTVQCRYLLCCAGLHADTLARKMGMQPNVIVIPFRGEYYTLRPERRLVRGLIYPVPDPQFPFLGVHFTKKIHGEYEAGPNAVLAFAREGYRFRNISLKDLFQVFSYPGFWIMASRYWKTEAYEIYRSLSRRAFVRALQKLVPDLRNEDLAPGGSGVRAQTVTREGLLVDDFQIVEGPNTIHVLNAPSPAATASIAIGRHIAELAARSFRLGT
jgi:L-2-hydroxyglutarate oxidase